MKKKQQQALGFAAVGVTGGKIAHLHFSNLGMIGRFGFQLAIKSNVFLGAGALVGLAAYGIYSALQDEEQVLPSKEEKKRLREEGKDKRKKGKNSK